MFHPRSHGLLRGKLPILGRGNDLVHPRCPHALAFVSCIFFVVTVVHLSVFAKVLPFMFY